ncbi:MAG: GNAT family N-acetyltransferase [Candidatus Eremiobacteraeota bacterium]|nr:GNAT family N-acetyltransferase [Candidatus Eremiobacteraeota bacterium]
MQVRLQSVPAKSAQAAPSEAFAGSLVELRRRDDASSATSPAAGERTFDIFDRATGAEAGSIDILNIRRDERALEIGNARIAPAYERRGFVRESLYLLLKYAFEEWGAVRVSFVVDEHNGRARGALVRLGAVYEGTLRFHRATEGTRHNDALYSIIKPEWPQVRAQLEFRFLRASHSARLCSLPSVYPSGA